MAESVIHKIRGPDGKIHKLRGPADATPEQVIMELQFALDTAESRRNSTRQADAKQTKEMLDPTGNFAENMLAGAGKFFTDVGQGARDIGADLSRYTDPSSYKQRQAEIDQEIAAKRKIDAPLMETMGGKVGYVGAGAAPMLAAAAIPGVNTMTGAAVTGGAFGASQPTLGSARGSQGESRTQNIAMGAGLGAAGQGAANLAGRAIANRRMVPPPQRTAREDLIQRAMAEGVVLDPVDTNPGMFNRLARGIAGKTQTEKKFSGKNQAVWNRLAREDLELAPDVDITVGALDDIRAETGRIYERIGDVVDEYVETPSFYAELTDAFDEYSKLLRDNGGDRIKELDDLFALFERGRFPADTIMIRLRRLRENAEAYLSKAASSPENRADQLLKGRTYKSVAKAVENMVEENLRKSGNQQLYEAFIRARTRHAKTYTYEKALLPGGDINAHKIGQEAARGKPLSPRGQLIGDLAREFPQTTRRLTGADDSFSVFSTTGGLAAGATGHPGVAAMLGARPAIRGAIGMPAVNRRIANPAPYADPSMVQLGQGLLNSPTGRTMAQGITPMAAGFYNPFLPADQGGPRR